MAKQDNQAQQNKQNKQSQQDKQSKQTQQTQQDKQSKQAQQAQQAQQTQQAQQAQQTQQTQQTQQDKQSKQAQQSKRGRQAKVVTPYGHVFDFRRPVRDPQTEIDLYNAVASGKRPSPNTGLMTAKEYGQAVRAQQAAEENGELPPSVPAVYSMIRRQIANEFRATCIVSGQRAKGRKPLKQHNIPESLAKTFGDGDRVFTDKQGNVIPLRLCHKPDVRKLVTDNPDDNILTIGKHQYVVGTTDQSAVFLINGSKTGNYGANIRAGKMLSFEHMGSKLKCLVAQINNEAEIITLDDGTDPGCQYPVPPHSIVRWGHLVRDGKELTPAAIRKAVASGDTKGIKFVALSEPIVGHSFNRSEFWKVVKRVMSQSRVQRNSNDNPQSMLDRFSQRLPRSGKEQAAMEQRAWHNLRAVQTRTNPNETFPFGMYNMQTGIVPVAHYGDSLDEELVSFVIGVFVGAEFSENRWEANYRLNPDDEAETEAESEVDDKVQGETEAAEVTATVDEEEPSPSEAATA